MRYDGLYHIRYKGKWTVGEWVTLSNFITYETRGWWHIIGSTESYSDNQIEIVGEKIEIKW